MVQRQVPEPLPRPGSGLDRKVLSLDAGGRREGRGRASGRHPVRE